MLDVQAVRSDFADRSVRSAEQSVHWPKCELCPPTSRVIGRADSAPTETLDARPIAWATRKPSLSHAEGAYCPSGETPGDFVAWWAEQTDDGNAYAVVETFIDVKGSFLFEVDRRDSEVPFEWSALPPGGGDDFCGAPVAGAAAG